MKRTTKRHYNGAVQKQVIYPNAATASYRYNKLVDYLLTGATTLGIAAAILLLMIL